MERIRSSAVGEMAEAARDAAELEELQSAALRTDIRSYLRGTFPAYGLTEFRVRLETVLLDGTCVFCNKPPSHYKHVANPNRSSHVPVLKSQLLRQVDQQLRSMSSAAAGSSGPSSSGVSGGYPSAPPAVAGEDDLHPPGSGLHTSPGVPLPVAVVESGKDAPKGEEGEGFLASSPEGTNVLEGASGESPDSSHGPRPGPIGEIGGSNPPGDVGPVTDWIEFPVDCAVMLCSYSGRAKVSPSGGQVKMITLGWGIGPADYQEPMGPQGFYCPQHRAEQPNGRVGVARPGSAVGSAPIERGDVPDDSVREMVGPGAESSTRPGPYRSSSFRVAAPEIHR